MLNKSKSIALVKPDLAYCCDFTQQTLNLFSSLDNQMLCLCVRRTTLVIEQTEKKKTKKASFWGRTVIRPSCRTSHLLATWLKQAPEHFVLPALWEQKHQHTCHCGVRLQMRLKWLRDVKQWVSWEWAWMGVTPSSDQGNIALRQACSVPSLWARLTVVSTRGPDLCLNFITKNISSECNFLTQRNQC